MAVSPVPAVQFTQSDLDAILRAVEVRNTRHEVPTSHDLDMAQLEAVRYDNGIDIADSRYL